ncbi:PAS domain-containing sensor histidine kinase [Thaumasiovibrio subtropicus]|uniref:PAS domain-containing sensor histidine kinase n=1 Tax=Thaumasiovibrio subtropicus TaxID=1891207 RepID=UPI000B351F55|nr:PAS domain-containing sensor histidine kinase [Thaumasiovibrio subtropicus]
MDSYFDSEKLQETLIELHRCQQREQQLKEENTAILAGIAAMAGASNKIQIFNSLLEVIRRYIDFESALVLSRESGFQNFKELVGTQSHFSHCQWQADQVFMRAINGESIALFDPLRTNEFSRLPPQLHGYVRSALLTGVKVSSGDAILVFTHSKPNAFTSRCRQVIDRFRPLLERTIIDIDYRERLQALVSARTQELIESRLRFKDFARTAGDWFWEIDKSSRFTYLSTPSVETHRINKTSLFDIISGQHPRESLKSLLASEVAFSEFECQLSQDDDSRWFELSGKPFYDKDGQFQGFRGTAKDITSRRQHLQELTEARRQADLANKAKSQFLAMMSHEIRTPLNAVMGLMDTLVESGLSNEQESWVNQMDQSAQLLLNIINDVLDLSKIEAGNVELYLEPMEVRERIYLICQQLKPQAEKKGLACKLHIDSAISEWMISDKNRFSQILFNLMGNAIKFTHEGEIAIRAVKEAGLLRIDISDTGIGIDKVAQKQLFTPFVQADGSITREFGGTGLGLAISQLLVHKMGGEISLESELGKGSCFTIRLPLEACSAPNQIQAPHEEVRTEQLRILVVEDSRANQMIAKLMLERAGHKVEVAEHGKAAVDLMLESRRGFDIILMDVSMPIMDGFEATKLLRAGGVKLPIIATTANAMEADRKACLDAGMTDFLAKPIRANAMKALLQKYQ